MTAQYRWKIIQRGRSHSLKGDCDRLIEGWEEDRLILIGLETILKKLFFIIFFNSMSQALQFREADLLLTIAKWFFISLNSGIRQIKVHESNVDIININYLNGMRKGGGATLLQATLSSFVTSQSLPYHSLLWVVPSCPFITGLLFFPFTESNPVYPEGGRGL